MEKEGEKNEEEKNGVVDSNETIFFRSQGPIKAVCLQNQAVSAEKGEVVGLRRGGLSGIDGERSGWQTEQKGGS